MFMEESERVKGNPVINVNAIKIFGPNGLMVFAEKIHDTRRKHSHRSSKRAQHSSSRARSWAKRNQSPGQDVEDPLTFKAARAKAHRDTDKHLRKRPHKHAPASRSAHLSNVT